MLFLGFEDVFENFARDIVPDAFAMGDRFAQVRNGHLFQLQIAFEDLLDVLPDQQLAQILQVRQPLQKQDPFDQPIGMLHLVDRFLVFVVAQPAQAPVLQHPRMEEILVDGRQLVAQNLVQVGNNLFVALHGDAFRFALPMLPVCGFPRQAGKLDQSRCSPATAISPPARQSRTGAGCLRGSACRNGSGRRSAGRRRNSRAQGSGRRSGSSRSPPGRDTGP